jgi:hypothetical protein
MITEGLTDPNFCFVSQEPLLHLVLLPVYGCETLPLTMMEYYKLQEF